MILHSANSKKRLKSKKAICSIILPNSRMTWPSSTFNLVFPSIFRWKMSLTGLFYPLATLGNKIKPLKAHLPTQYWWKNKISSGKRSRHSEFGKIIEQSTIYLWANNCPFADRTNTFAMKLLKAQKSNILKLTS